MLKLNHSQHAVVSKLKYGEPKTRKELCLLTNLSWAAISKTITQLQGLGIIRSEDNQQITKKGRPPTRIELNSNMFIIGISITKKKIEVGLFSLNQKKIKYSEVEVQEGDDLLPLCVILLKKLLTKDIISNLIGIGISFPGLIENNKQYIINSTHISEYNDRSLGEEIRLALKLEIPIFTERNAVCDLTYLLLSKKIKNDTILLTLKDGVSAAVYIDNKILYGSSGNIGELGHLKSPKSKIPCVCGKAGCIETEIGGIAWERKYTKLSKAKRSYSNFTDAVNSNDKSALNIIKDSIPYLYPILGHLILLLKPYDLAFSTALPPSKSLIISTEIKNISKRENLDDKTNLLIIDNDSTVTGAAMLPLMWLSGNPQYARLNHP